MNQAMGRTLEEFPLTGEHAPRLHLQARIGNALSSDGLEDLVESIRESGQLQAGVVEPSSDGTGVDVVCGERRLRALRLGASRYPDHPHFRCYRAEVEPHRLSVWARRRAQLAENLARTGLEPRELAWGIVDARAVMLADRMTAAGYNVPAHLTEITDPRHRLDALVAWRSEHGPGQVGAPVADVLNELGLELSVGRAKQLVTAYTALPEQFTEALDDLGANAENRLRFVRVWKNAGDRVANELLDVIRSRPDPQADVAAIMREANLGIPPNDVWEAVQRRRASAQQARVDKVRRGDDGTYDAAEAMRQLVDLTAALRAGVPLRDHQRPELLAMASELHAMLRADARLFVAGDQR